MRRCGVCTSRANSTVFEKNAMCLVGPPFFVNKATPRLDSRVRKV